MTEDDPIKYRGKFSTNSDLSIDQFLQQPQRVNHFLLDYLFPLGGVDGGPVTYRISHPAQEAWEERQRRASLSRRERWREDHPHFFRKLFPWTITRWEPESDEDEWDDDDW